MKAVFNKKSVDDSIKRKFKKIYKKKISTSEINKIWKDWIDECIVKPLNVGTIAKLDKESKIWVKAIPTHTHKRAVSLRSKGLAYVSGKIREANINFDTSKYIYKVVFETERFNEKIKLFYKPHINIKKSVSEGIVNGKLITRL
jgi:hypothetical protein